MKTAVDTGDHDETPDLPPVSPKSEPIDWQECDVRNCPSRGYPVVKDSLTLIMCNHHMHAHGPSLAGNGWSFVPEEFTAKEG